MPPQGLADLLPGLWFLALAALLVAGLRRLGERLPGPVLLTFAAVIALLFGRFLVGGESFLPLDSLRGHPPFTALAPTDPPANPLHGDLIELLAPAGAAVRQALAHGELPLWNPYAGAGMPLLANPQAQVLQPLAIVALPFSVDRAVAITAALQVLCALVFMFLFLRRQTLQPGPALFGALAWGLGSFVQLWLGWPIATTAALLPALLLGLARVAARDPHASARGDVLLLAAVAWAFLLAGHPETVLYGLGLGGLFLAVRLRALAQRRVPLSRALVGLALAAGLAAPAWVPTLAYLPQTLRAARLADPPPPPVAGDAVDRAVARLLPVVAPQVFGNDRYFAYWGPQSFAEDAGGFAGTATLLLAALALFPRRGRRPPERCRRPQERLFLAVAGAALAVIAQAPGVVALLSRLPGGAASGYQHRLLLLAAFGLVYAAACELDRRLASETLPGEAPAAAKRWAPVLAAALVLGGLLAWAYLEHPHPRQPEALAILRFGWLRWQLRFLAGTTLLLVLMPIRRLAPLRRLLRPLLLWGGLAAAVAAELLLLHLPLHPGAPPRLAFPRPAPLSFLAEHAETDRLVGLDLALLPNLATIYGLNDARVYDPMAPAAYFAATAPLLTRWAGEIPDFAHPEHPLYDLLGVRWVLAPPGAVPPASLRVALQDPSAEVWERPSALPRLFLPATAEPQPVDWPSRLAAIPDFRREALVEGLATRWEAGRPGEGRLDITSRRPGAIRGDFAAPEARWLASSVYQDGGWRVRVDGQPVRTVRSNGIFVGAWIPAGEHTVELTYRPPGLALGCGLAGLALAGLAWWWRESKTAGTSPAATV